MHKFNTSLVFHLYILELTSWIWTRPSLKGWNWEPFKMKLIWGHVTLRYTNSFPLTSVGVVHSIWPSRAMWHVHAPTFNKWHKKRKKKKKKVTIHILTHGAMRWCGLTSLVVCTNDQKSWYKGEKCDNKEWNLNYKHPFLRVLEC